MIKDVLEHIGGIENFGILSIVIFFVVFLGMLGWACRLKPPFLKHMAALPLDPSDDPPTSCPPSHA